MLSYVILKYLGRYISGVGTPILLSAILGTVQFEFLIHDYTLEIKVVPTHIFTF